MGCLMWSSQHTAELQRRQAAVEAAEEAAKGHAARQRALDEAAAALEAQAAALRHTHAKHEAQHAELEGLWRAHQV